MKGLIVSLLAAVMLAGTVASASAQRYSRIKFAKGAVSAVVSGTLSGYNARRFYKIRVKAGQTISTRQVSRGTRDLHVITIYLLDPQGNNVNDMDASCNNHASFSPTVAGDYTFEVFQCQKADEWNGSFKFKVSVR